MKVGFVRVFVGLRLGALGLLACGVPGCASAQLDTTGQSQTPRTLRDDSPQGNVPSGAGQHPALRAPHTLGDGDTGKPDLKTVLEREAVAEKEKAPPTLSFQPDPEPTSSTDQWVYTFRYRRGEMSLEQVTFKQLPKATPAARRIGRFALELWIGRELLERVRFDFPLLGAPLADGPQGVELESGLDTTQAVWLPDVARATRAQLVDRSNGKVLELPWPPNYPGDPAPPAKTAP